MAADVGGFVWRAYPISCRTCPIYFCGRQACDRRRGGQGAPVSIQLYPGAYHDFDWPGQARRELTADRTSAGVVPIVAMDPAAMEDAHRRVLDFLAGVV